MENTSRKCGLLYSKQYLKEINRLPVHKNRDIYYISLLDNIPSIISSTNFQLVAPFPATFQDFCSYHTLEYVNILRATQETTLLQQHQLEQMQLIDDSYVFAGLWEYCRWVGGASLSAAKALASRNLDIAINWAGGRHHAKKNKASGFCYINDVVLAVEELQKQGLTRVLCLDLDIHHGDGVEEAFYYSSSVFTLSFHKCACGFFPGTGQARNVGQGPGRYTTLNVPLDDGVVDEEYVKIVSSITQTVIQAFKPDAIVAVCGIDTLSTDPLGTFNLTPLGIGRCVAMLRETELPLLLLGGGGYNPLDAAKCFIVLTAAALDENWIQQLPEWVPEHHYFTHYQSNRQMINKRVIHRPNKNTSESLQQTQERALRQIQRYIRSLT